MTNKLFMLLSSLNSCFSLFNDTRPMSFLIIMCDQVCGSLSNIDWSQFATTWLLATKWFNPYIIILFSTTHNIKSFSALDVLLTKLMASLDFDLVHASIFFFSIDIACRLKYTLMRAERMESRVFDRRLAFPVFCNIDNLLKITFRVERCGSFSIIWSDTNLVACSHTERQCYECC